MKFFLWITFALSCGIMRTHGEEIPKCLQEEIKNHPEYLGLYLAEIEGQQLYFFKKPAPKGADLINVTIFYDKDCQQANSSASGGLTGRPRGYKPYKVIKTIWEKESYPMKTFLNQKQKFEVRNTYSDLPQFKFADNQQIYISAKEGLQLITKGKAAKTFKLIFKKPVYHHPTTGITPPTENVPANAWLLEYDGQNWLLLANGSNLFTLKPTDAEGKHEYKDGWVDLRLVE